MATGKSHSESYIGSGWYRAGKTAPHIHSSTLLTRESGLLSHELYMLRGQTFFLKLTNAFLNFCLK